jgi:hypothetical protein
VEGQYDLGNEWVTTLGYQGTATRHLTETYNFFLYAYGKLNLGTAAFNPVLNGFGFYDNNGRGNFNAFLATLRHRFSRSFQLETQYRLSRSKDTGSNNYFGGNYQYTMDREYGPSDYDATHVFKMFGIWSPTIFRGNQSYLEKIAGGWTISGILNAHTGYPWNPVYSNLGGDAVYQGSGGGPLRPAGYSHGLSPDFRDNASHPGGGTAFFTPPSYVAGPSLSAINAGTATPGPVPGAPGVPRNAFRGPGYLDFDMTLSKSFGLPTMKVLGEGAKIELKANFFNLFNKVNLSNIQNNITDVHFGQAQNALGSRTIELQGRFSF